MVAGGPSGTTQGHWHRAGVLGEPEGFLSAGPGPRHTGALITVTSRHPGGRDRDRSPQLRSLLPRGQGIASTELPVEETSDTAHPTTLRLCVWVPARASAGTQVVPIWESSLPSPC